MAKPQTLQGKIVVEYLNEYPDMPDMTLAKLIYSKNKASFTSLDAVRSVVRYYKGHVGNNNRAKVSTKKHIKPLTYDTNPFKLPASYAAIREDFHVAQVSNNVLMLSDIHIPYQNNEAITLCLNYGKDKQ